MLRLLRLHPARVLTAPRARIARRSRQRSVVAIDGLVCGVCAARTQRALAGLPGVAAVEVDLASGLATIEHAASTRAGAPPDGAALQAALDGVVVAVGLRRWLARWATRLRRSEPNAQRSTARWRAAS